MVGVDHVYEIPDNLPPSMAVVRSVASVEGLEETNVTVLAETIDPNALNKIVNESGARVEFDYEGYTVVASEDEIQLIE